MLGGGEAAASGRGVASLPGTLYSGQASPLSLRAEPSTLQLSSCPGDDALSFQDMGPKV